MSPRAELVYAYEPKKANRWAVDLSMLPFYLTFLAAAAARSRRSPVSIDVIGHLSRYRQHGVSEGGKTVTGFLG